MMLRCHISASRRIEKYYQSLEWASLNNGTRCLAWKLRTRQKSRPLTETCDSHRTWAYVEVYEVFSFTAEVQVIELLWLDNRKEDLQWTPAMSVNYNLIKLKRSFVELLSIIPLSCWGVWLSKHLSCWIILRHLSCLSESAGLDLEIYCAIKFFK